jgi:hypothetical protein
VGPPQAPLATPALPPDASGLRGGTATDPAPAGDRPARSPRKFEPPPPVG